VNREYLQAELRKPNCAHGMRENSMRSSRNYIRPELSTLTATIAHSQIVVTLAGCTSTNTPSAQERWTAAFVQRLHELGWIGGRTVAIEYRWAEGRTERFAESAAELVKIGANVIVTAGSFDNSL
jgi:hypothetical protein